MGGPFGQKFTGFFYSLSDFLIAQLSICLIYPYSGIIGQVFEFCQHFKFSFSFIRPTRRPRSSATPCRSGSFLGNTLQVWLVSRQHLAGLARFSATPCKSSFFLNNTLQV